jgi:hypothetical protein
MAFAISLVWPLQKKRLLAYKEHLSNTYDLGEEDRGNNDDAARMCTEEAGSGARTPVWDGRLSGVVAASPSWGVPYVTEPAFSERTL